MLTNFDGVRIRTKMGGCDVAIGSRVEIIDGIHVGREGAVVVYGGIFVCRYLQNRVYDMNGMALDLNIVGAWSEYDETCPHHKLVRRLIDAEHEKRTAKGHVASDDTGTVAKNTTAESKGEGEEEEEDGQEQRRDIDNGMKVVTPHGEGVVEVVEPLKDRVYVRCNDGKAYWFGRGLITSVHISSAD